MIKRIHWFYFASPVSFFPLARGLAPFFFVLSLPLLLFGLWISFFEAPTDATQGEAYRIIFIHVPAAWLSMFLYVVMAAYAAVGFIFNARLASMMAEALAPTGAIWTALALWTGALWGRPTWGTYWASDARMMSELFLLFLYLGVLLLRAAIEDARRADRATGVLSLMGVVDVPIIYYSVQWWNTLHQGASVSMTRAPHMAHIMLVGMLIMALGCWSWSIAMVLWRVQGIILEREPAAARWIAPTTD